jgi:hypothetical protein
VVGYGEVVEELYVDVDSGVGVGACVDIGVGVGVTSGVVLRSIRFRLLLGPVGLVEEYVWVVLRVRMRGAGLVLVDASAPARVKRCQLFSSAAMSSYCICE